MPLAVLCQCLKPPGHGKPNHWQQTAGAINRLSKEIGVTSEHIGRVLLGTRGIGGDLALRLARFFGTSAQLWMTLQSQYELDVAEDKSGRSIAKRVQPHAA